MASYTLMVLLSVTTLFVAVLGTEFNDDETELLYQLYNEEMQKRDDSSLMNYLLQKRGRGGSSRKCMYKQRECTCDYRFGPDNERRYIRCTKA